MDHKKSILEVIVLPISITLIGIIGTFFITKTQIESTKSQNENNLKSSEKLMQNEQQIKILAMFFEKISNSDPRQRELSIKLLSAIDTNLARKLASAILTDNSESEGVRKSAENLLVDMRNFPIEAYIHIQNKEQKKVAEVLQGNLQSNSIVVPGIENVGSKWGGKSKTELRYFHISDTIFINSMFKSAFKASNIDFISQQTKGYESKTARGHFEIIIGTNK